MNENQDKRREIAHAEFTSSEPNHTVRDLKRSRKEWFANMMKLPLGKFLVSAWQLNEQERQDQPEWQTQLFWFVWVLRGHPDMQSLLRRPAAASELVERQLKHWSAQRRRTQEEPPYGSDPSDSWMEWFGVPKADALAEFFDVWQKARFRPGEEPLQQALIAARETRLQLPQDVQNRRPSGDARTESSYSFFISFAGHLQVLVGDQNIKLPCELLAGMFNLSKMTISRYRRWAQEDGFLKTMKQHRFRSGGNGDATEFRFDVGRWKCLSDKAQEGCEARFACS